jgi:hypothetical protein
MVQWGLAGARHLQPGFCQRRHIEKALQGLNRVRNNLNASK